MERLFAIALLTALPGVAWADETPHSRASCPEGSTATGGLGGSDVCTPTNCREDSDCAPGRLCRDRPLCIETRMGPSTPTTKTAVGSCESGGKCTYPAECEEASKRCVRAGLVERYRTSCGCSEPGRRAEGDGAATFSLLGAVGLLRHRRARRARGV